MGPGLRISSVLVVDDDRKLADALAVVLEQNGYSATVAYSGSDAIRSALKAPPDFILMDIRMRGIDGVDAAIAVSETLPHCRVLLMSGATDASQILRKASRRGHSFEVLTKPVLTDSLLDMLRA